MNIMLDNSATEENKKGHEVYVSQRSIQVTPDQMATYLEYGLWGLGAFIFLYVFSTKSADAVLILTLLKALCGFVPAIWFLLRKKDAESYFAALQQKIQAAASEIDNYNRTRFDVLRNLFELTKASVKLDKEVMTTVAAYRGGINITNENRNQVAGTIDNAFRALLPQIEAYPDLKAHAAIADAMQQNNYLTKELTAARTCYNDLVLQWNRDLFQWPIRRMTAASMQLKTMIPFALSADERKKCDEISF